MSRSVNRAGWIAPGTVWRSGSRTRPGELRLVPQTARFGPNSTAGFETRQAVPPNADHDLDRALLKDLNPTGGQLYASNSGASWSPGPLERDSPQSRLLVVCLPALAKFIKLWHDGCVARGGRSWCRLPTICLVLGLILLAGCGSSAGLSTARGGANPESIHLPKATRLPVTAEDVTSLTKAFVRYMQLPPTCPAVQKKGYTSVATEDDTGTSWALALFLPAPGCIIYRLPYFGEPPGPGPNGGYPYPAATILAFATGQRSVFSKLPGQPWQMDSLSGKPFPCPAPLGAAPGVGNGALPLSVCLIIHLCVAAGS